MSSTTFFEQHPKLAKLDPRYRETFQAIARYLIGLQYKREISALVLNDTNYATPDSKQTYSDHLHVLIDHGLIEEDERDSEVIFLTPLGREFHDALIERLPRRKK